jgi:uncharacterized protein with HEPN domain
MFRDDAVRVRHMLDAAREVSEAVRGKDAAEIQADHLRMLGIIKSIEIIGEAACQISADYQARHQNIPWMKIIGMRHRLVHAYFEIDEEQVWKTATENIPVLIAGLEKLLESQG